MESIRILVNGEGRDIPSGISVNDLIDSLALEHKRIAVELNAEVLRRTFWSETRLHDADRLEIVHFVGGG